MEVSSLKIEKLISWLVLIALLLVAIILWRPFWHGFAIHVLYLAPMFWMGLLLSIGGSILLGLRIKTEKSPWTTQRVLMIKKGFVLKKFFASILILFGMLWLFVSMFTSILMTAQLYHDEVKPNIEKIAVLPNTSPDNFRMMPYQIARNNARNTLTFSRYRLGNLDFVVNHEGKLLWNAALVPDGFWNTLSRKPLGAVYIDATTSQFNLKVVESTFPYSDSIRFADNIKWRACKLDYWAAYSDPYYLRDKDEGIVAVLSKRKFRWAWYGGIFPVRVPYFAGVYLFYPDRKIVWVPANKINETPILNGQQVFPEELARRIGSSFFYPHSILNSVLRHKDQCQVADVPSEGNKFPYFITTEGLGPQWFLALEPWGSTYGLKMILLIDARTGHIRLWQKKKTDTVIGAVKALEYIKSNSYFQNVKWYEGGDNGGGGFIVIEPLPVFRNGEFWWKATVTRLNKIAITNIAFISAMNPQNVVIVKNSDEAYQFIRGEKILSATSTEKIIDFSTAISQIDRQIRELENIPEEFKSAFWEKQLSDLRALRQFLIQSSTSNK